MNRALFLLLTVLSSCCCDIINNKRAVFIYSEGYGGDHYASSTIEKMVKNNKIHLYNVKSLKEIEGKSNLYKSSELYAIGQVACNKMIKENINEYDGVSCYAHIIDKNIMNFIRNYDSNKNINFFVNENQSYKLPFKLHDNVKIHTSHGIVPTFNIRGKDVKKHFMIDKNLVTRIFQNKTFLIGGNFIDADYKKIIVDMESYLSLIKRNLKNKDKDISIVLYPRFFDNCDNAICKVDKLKIFKKGILEVGVNPVLYVSKNIHDSSKEFASIASISPNFNSIIYGVYNLKLKNSVIYTIDQCNIATDDYKNKMFGDYLVEDSDHMSIYQSSRNKKSFLINKIVNHINNIK